MSNHTPSFVGDHHILLRIKGSPEAIEQFHHIVKSCDNDWPFLDRTPTKVCRVCCGAVWRSPRVLPGDLKAAARQTGVKIKIRNFAPVTHCRGTNLSFDVRNDYDLVPLEEARKLYGPHGVLNYREAKGLTGAVAVAGLPTHPLEPTVPPADPEPPPTVDSVTRESLIAEVLGGSETPGMGGTTTPCLPLLPAPATPTTCNMSPYSDVDPDIDLMGVAYLGFPQ